VICSTRLAPINTEVISGFRSTHASAICAIVCPRPRARSFSLVTRSTTAGVTCSALRNVSGLDAREPSGIPLR
jgi:hypothetical protein